MNPPPLNCSSNKWISYPSGARSLATVNEAGPPPTKAIFLPLKEKGP